MLRFTIRDLLWLTVVVALGVGWWMDRSRLVGVAASADAVQAIRHETGDYPLNPSVPASKLPSD